MAYFTLFIVSEGAIPIEDHKNIHNIATLKITVQQEGNVAYLNYSDIAHSYILIYIYTLYTTDVTYFKLLSNTILILDLHSVAFPLHRRTFSH